jgi:uncharacterized protein YjiS (DUF1127 family)
MSTSNVRGLPRAAANSPGRADASCSNTWAKRLIAATRLTIGRWVERARQRRALRRLAERDDYLLKDIGVSQQEAFREADKPFWRP